MGPLSIFAPPPITWASLFRRKTAYSAQKFSGGGFLFCLTFRPFALGQIKRGSAVFPFHDQAAALLAKVDSNPLDEEKIRQFFPVNRILYGVVVGVLYQLADICPRKKIGMNDTSA